jgi:hypothetical protein
VQIYRFIRRIDAVAGGTECKCRRKLEFSVLDVDIYIRRKRAKRLLRLGRHDAVIAGDEQVRYEKDTHGGAK